jgi:Tol biopolymer transport system component
MSDPRWQRIEEICHGALEHPLSERAAYVRDACTGDTAMCAEVESLLANKSGADGLGSGLGIRELGFDLIGKQIGVYQIVSLLGSGGMGQVYRARDTRLHRDVAIKVLPPEFALDADRRARIEREARVLASFNHPNIGAIHGLAEDGNNCCLVLELVDGITLAERLTRGPLPIAEVLRYARQMADALDAAHQKGIVHRDLKPANIKIAPDGTLKILDFGLARAVAETSNAKTSDAVTIATHPGAILGTPAYMSPEQARGDAVDKRADIWSFGCVVYEMLTGAPVFGGRTASDRIAATLEREPDWSALPPKTPLSLRRVVRRCLEKDPVGRLRDIADARNDLDEDAGAGGNAVAVVPSSNRKSGSVRWLIGGASAVLVAAVSLLPWLPVREAEVAHQAVAPVFSRLVRLTSGSAREMGAAISPDGKWVAYMSNTGGRQDVWVTFIAGGYAANLTASAGLDISATTGIGGLEISPDGTRVAVMARQRGSRNNFETWEIPAPLPGVPHKLLEEGFLGLRWSPDGRHVVFIRAGSAAGDALWVADADGTNRHEIIKAGNGMHVHWPSWAPDGFIYFMRTFSTISNLDQTEIYRIRSTGGPIEPVVLTTRRAAYPMPTPDGLGLIYAANPTSADASLWWRSMSGGEPVRLTTGIGEYVEPRLSADGRVLVFTLNEQRQSLTRIAVGVDRAEMAAVTDGFSGDLDPNISPSGNRIAFSSSRSGDRHLWTAQVDGSDLRPLTTGHSSDDRPTYSPDGQQIAFMSDRSGRRAIWLIGADGGAPRKLIDTSPTGGLNWSRDGRHIVYAASEGAWPTLAAVSVADGVTHHIPTPGVVAEPAWSPTRDVIAYLSPSTTGGTRVSLAFVDADGHPQYLSLPRIPETGTGFTNGMVAWSPDGRQLALADQNSNAVASIWIIEPDSVQPRYRKLVELSGGARIRGITWTRDGSAIIIGRHDVTGDVVLMQ